MPRIDWDDADKYSGGKNSFFSLADDGDKAIVRFYHKDLKDIDVIPVHKVNVNNRNRSVACLRSPDSSRSECPFCESGIPVSVRAFLKLLVYTQDKNGYYTLNPECMIWERGASMRKQLSSLINRYGKNGLMNKVFEIERCGKKGDQKTTYQIYPVDDLEEDECPIPDEEDLSFPDVMEGIVMDKSYEDMEYYLDHEDFPKEEENTRGRNNSRNERNTRSDRTERTRTSVRQEEEDDEEPEEEQEEQEEMPTGRRRRVTEQPQNSDDDEPEPPRRRRRI